MIRDFTDQPYALRVLTALLLAAGRAEWPLSDYLETAFATDELGRLERLAGRLAQAALVARERAR